MFTHRGEIIRGILIGSGIFVCSIILFITVYFLYRYRKESFYLNKKEIHWNKTKQFSIDQTEEQITNNQRSNSIGNTSTIIEELMRKSLQLAQTVEKVADDKEKRISLKDKMNLDF